ncbi:hypothetical protein CON36_34575 [Bacillus cereus]|uniref:Uncharacterized protein n=1 Tax=Bacillus cereus TaxID=1396 RepID=A0A9X6SSE9_BACCE|nr:hypothetical protein [Bacillus cereus]PDZ94289.1 hypothetical protein CON36_34575 [Bacillus cereus]
MDKIKGWTSTHINSEGKVETNIVENSLGWVTIYFKSGKVVETILDSFSVLDERKDKEEIDRIEMGTRRV